MLIDTAVLVWGSSHVPTQRLARGPFDYRSTLPLYVNFADLSGRLGSEEGPVRTITYGEDEYRYGHWQEGAAELLYSEKTGRLELRGSLPKLVVGRNDIVLDQVSVHEGIRRLVEVGSELAGWRLDLAEAVPSRLDYCYQWEVPSVAFVLEHLRSSFRPGRRDKIRTEIVSPLFGGHSLVWGYRTKRALRWYDKGAEAAERAYKSGELEQLGIGHELAADLPLEDLRREIRQARRRAREAATSRGEALGYRLDGILRFEIQERRPEQLRTIHKHGYTGRSVQVELERAVAALGAVAYRDLDELLAATPRRRIPRVLGCLWLQENEPAWAIVRRHMGRSAFYALRRDTYETQLAVGDWRPEIPINAFGRSCSLWKLAEAA